MPRTSVIRSIVLYAICILGGILTGLVASAMIIRAAAGPRCCAPGDGIGAIMLSLVLIPLGALLGIILAATVLRLKLRTENQPSL